MVLDILYTKTILGKNRKKIRMVKLRTMQKDAERDYLNILKSNGDKIGRIQNDPRITRLGRLLRPTRIDEQPQWINFLLGDFDLIEERPKTPAEWSIYPKDYIERALQFKPGLFPFSFAHPPKSFKEKLDLGYTFFDKKEKNYQKTNLEYFPKILRNFFNGLRKTNQ